MVDLVISLGHNSSAIAVDKGRILCGYEEERFSGKKADSAYPMQAINRLAGSYKFKNAYVGYWNVDGKIPTDKHLNIDHLSSLVSTVYGLSANLDTQFTHHDSHYIAAMAFAGEDFLSDCMTIVADGFGTMGEVISIYDRRGGTNRVILRAFGYDKSLGLLYQYATSYMGMKEHNHEYKMLAYEALILDVECDLSVINRKISEDVKRRISDIKTVTIKREFDPMIMVEALTVARLAINYTLDSVVSTIAQDDHGNVSSRDLRIVVSYYVQAVVEQVISSLVPDNLKSNLLLSGGLFYNVKLNSILADKCRGKTCVYPLAGDQGAALGVYFHSTEPDWSDNIFFGHRKLDFADFELDDSILVFKTMDDAMSSIVDELGALGFVNIVRDSMEFGPRSLCNTCTLGLPTEEVVESINIINDRTNEMPMAPVMTEDQVAEYFIGTAKIHKSLEYMVMARTYKPGMAQKVKGAAHYYKLAGLYTGRPQVTRDPHICALLNEFGPLINTSFNYHGKPIVFERDSILETVRLQRAAAPNIHCMTIVITGE